MRTTAEITIQTALKSIRQDCNAGVCDDFDLGYAIGKVDTATFFDPSCMLGAQGAKNEMLYLRHDYQHRYFPGAPR